MKKQIISGIIIITGLLGGTTLKYNSEEECRVDRDILIQKTIDHDIVPEDYAKLKAIQELGCGLLSLNPENISVIDDVISDGDVFLHYTRVEYTKDRDKFFQKVSDKNARFGDVDYIAAYMNYEMPEEGITIQNFNGSNEDLILEIINELKK